MENLMLYPVYVHQQQDSAYGAIIPDLPGAHSAADELELLPRMIKEAS
jgi:predicted RNase H-like HicB family nuclease